MNGGIGLENVSKELMRQLESRKDYVAPVGRIAVTVRPGAVMPTESKFRVPQYNALNFSGLNGHSLGATVYAHQQIAEWSRIPWRYYEEMLTHNYSLAAQNVNSWFAFDSHVTRMVRTLDGKMRAFLSDRFRRLDHIDLMGVVVPELKRVGAQVISADVTERRLYVKATLPGLQKAVKKGDVVQAGIVIHNSEVGAGAVGVEPMIYRLSCLNGAIAPDSSLRKYHVGRGHDGDGGVDELLSREAKSADDRAFWLKVRDVVRGSFDRDVFEKIVERWQEAVGEAIKSDELPAVVEVTTNRLGLPESVNGRVLKSLIKGADLTKYGLANAITSVANDEKDYELTTDLERAGGRVIELSANDWKVISEATAKAKVKGKASRN